MCPVTEQLSPGVAAGTPRSAGRTVDLVATLFLLAAMLGGTVLLGLFSLVSVMATDSCGATDGPDLAICDGNYFALILVSYWAVLVGVPVFALIACVVRLTRHRLAWPFAVGGLVGLVLVTVVYFMLLSR